MGARNVRYVENTMESFRTAYALTSHCECDVWLTKDDRLVVYHDTHFDRMTDLEDPMKRISDFTYDELQEFDVVTGPNHEVRRKIPTFSELLDLVAADPSRVLFVELKEATGGLVAEMVRSRSMEEQINIISQHTEYLQEVISIGYPHVGFIGRRQEGAVEASMGCDNVGFSYRHVDATFVETIRRECGIDAFWVWNPVTPDEMISMKSLGVIGMGSNTLDLTIEVTRRSQTE